MLALAGYQLGIEFRFFDPNSGAPVGQIGQLVAAGYDDRKSLDRFLDGVDVVTYEFESIPLSAVQYVAQKVKVLPPINALATAQDRLLEKKLFQSLDIPTPRFVPIDNLEQLRSAADTIGLPLVLKTRRMGYDGKGQAVIRDSSAIERSFNALGGNALIAEEMIPFTHEMSVIGVRQADGQTVFYPPVENVHREGILRRSIAPAPSATPEMSALALDYCQRILDRLEYVGVLAMELFAVDGKLLANEISPRVHNSGHWTIEGAETSQFENHLRAILALPLGSTTPRGRSVMVNIIGHIPPRESVVCVEGAHLHLYGKAATEKRKVGHVTYVASSQESLRSATERIEKAVDWAPVNRV